MAMALTAVAPSTASAGSAPAAKGVTASTGISEATDISARRRVYRGGGGAAATCAHTHTLTAANVTLHTRNPRLRPAILLS